MPERALYEYTAPGLGAFLLTMQRMENSAYRMGATEAAAMIGDLFDAVLEQANKISREMAAASEEAMVTKAHQTQSRNRPYTGQMESHIRSSPGPLGLVRVGLVDELDKIVNPTNPRWANPFWRAQEYGTGGQEGGHAGGGVPDQIGRRIFGTFYPSGTPPDSNQRGLGAGEDLMFLSMGDAPGLGRISVELPGRHFLRDGATATAQKYQEAHAALRARSIEGLRAAVTLATTGKPLRRRGKRVVIVEI